MKAIPSPQKLYLPSSEKLKFYEASHASSQILLVCTSKIT